jgi:hypothetical protein
MFEAIVNLFKGKNKNYKKSFEGIPLGKLELNFPRGIISAEDKVIYSLQKCGTQSYYNLLLSTGLSDLELKRSTNKLIKEHMVSTGEFQIAPRLAETSRFESKQYSLDFG